MDVILIVGVIVLVGFVAGEVLAALRMPKVTGYLLAGILLNPGILGLMPKDFTEHTDVVTGISLCFITFSIGGTLHYSRIKRLGKTILYVTLCEAEFAFLAVIGGFLLLGPHLPQVAGAGFAAAIIPMSLLLGSLGAPTDPSATLAVVHQYKAKGTVTSTIMGVAAMDDALGIMNFSLGLALATAFTQDSGFSVRVALVDPFIGILGAIALGAAFGGGLGVLCRLVARETEGALIVIILGLLTLCFGCARFLGVDELMATMTMGATVVNFSAFQEKIFRILERYTEELIFVLFFTISGMQLNLSVLSSSVSLVLAFVVFRAVGKLTGAQTGAALARAPRAVRRYVGGGLIPQGGIVIGLALLIRQNPAFKDFSDIVINVIIGATVLHEIVGPFVSKFVLSRARELHPSDAPSRRPDIPKR